MGGPEVAVGAPTGRYGEIYDRGYQHYDGARLGRRHAIWALVSYSMKRALGVKKGWGSKMIPITLYVAAYLPVIVGIGIRRFVPTFEGLDYADYFGAIFFILGVFVAATAPELLCGDRSENVLPLYFSRAITRADYLFAKLGAASLLTLTISVIPAIILWLGRQLLDQRPLAAMRDHVGDLGRVVVAGVAIALFLGALGLVISSFTGRKSIAVGIIVVGFLISESLAGALGFALDDDHPLYRYVIFLSPTSTVNTLVARLFGERVPATDVGLWPVLAVMAAIVAACWLVMYLRYVPNE